MTEPRVIQNARFHQIIANLAVYSLAHGVVDATCAAVIFSLLKVQSVTPTEFFGLVISYNVLAFAFQALIGLAVDRWRAPRFAAVSGCILTAGSAVTIGISPLFSVFLAGIGNALFHVGAGTISLNLTPRRAAAPGVFVAPGVFGILIGTLVGKSGGFVSWPFVSLIAVLCIAIICLKAPKIDYETTKKSKVPDFFELIVLLLLLSIVVRSLIGTAMVFPWKSDLTLLIALTCAVFLGKFFGGILADKFGWMRVAVTALLVSAPLLAFGAGIPYVAMIGMFLFNMTMPVTLVAVSNAIPGRPGFAFGLTCLALIAGVLPVLADTGSFFGNMFVVLTVIFASAIALYFGLRLLSSGSGRRTSRAKKLSS